MVKYHEKPTCSMEFIVEGSLDYPVIGIRYPGRKLKRRNLKNPRNNSPLWANLFDFLVIPYINGKERGEYEFTFKVLLKDFNDYKINSQDFWKCIEELYKTNNISEEVPDLPGIDPKLYLRVLKWIWIQEDFNYKFGWEEVKSPIRYVSETRTGTPTKKGAGRGKFYAALILLKNNFSFEEVLKIIPLY